MDNKVDRLPIEVVQRKLKLSSWDKLDSDKMKQLMAMRKRISENTMKEIIKAVPEFASVAKESLASIRTSYEKTLKNNRDSSRKVQKLCEMKMSALEKMLEEDNLTFEEKKYICDEMSVIINRLAVIDRENKKFLMDLFAGTSTALVAVVAILVSVVKDRD